MAEVCFGFCFSCFKYRSQVNQGNENREEGKKWKKLRNQNLFSRQEDALVSLNKGLTEREDHQLWVEVMKWNECEIKIIHWIKRICFMAVFMTRSK